MALLEPWSTAKGGPLIVERVTFTEGRGNLIVTYPGVSAATRPDQKQNIPDLRKTKPANEAHRVLHRAASASRTSSP
eukprot:scaffold4449_cov93-Isochrysis_galbana.AAC.1